MTLFTPVLDKMVQMCPPAVLKNQRVRKGQMKKEGYEMMKGSWVVGRQQKKKRAEATFKGKKEPGNNFRCLPGGFNVTTSTDTTFQAASPPILLYPTRPTPLPVPPSCPSMRGDDVRSSISQPEAGDDMDNLACEFSPALDMVLRLHAPLQVRHARDEGVMVCLWEQGV